MENNEENKSFEDLSKYGQEEINRTLTREKIIKEVEADLVNNPRYKEFFEQYNESSVKSFINSYKSGKANWIMWGESFALAEERKILKYISIANEKLWEIQQKKLFNLQCQWRAEVITIPEIVTTFDFRYWETFIKHCPFLSPISEDEYDLYREYILSENFDTEPLGYHSWQDYDQYKSEHTNIDGSYMPEWYEFYDQRMGTNSLFLLPDTRGEKEDFYLKLYFDDQRKQKPELYAAQKNIDQRPYLNYYDLKTLDDFVETFEDLKIRDAYRSMRNSHLESIEYDSALNDAIETLKQAGNIEMTYAGNWRESIIKTARNYEKEKIYEAFSIAYKNYLNRLNMGIGFNQDVSEDTINFQKTLVREYRERILKGRALNGEPEDFNF